MRSPQAGRDPERVVYEVIERTSTATGQVLFFPDIEIATLKYPQFYYLNRSNQHTC